MKTIRKTVVNLLFITAVISIGLVFLKTNDSNSIKKVFGYSALNVMTGSMEPEIKTGSLIIIKDIDFNNVKVDDVITIMPNTSGGLVTHRVYDVLEDNEGRYLLTKGDANDVADSFKVRESMIEGKVVVSIPYVGQIIQFIKNNILLFCMFITGIFIVVSNLKKEKLEGKNEKI